MYLSLRVLFTLSIIASLALAQEFRATITGRVLDTSGSAVPNAAIRAVNLANNETSNATSDGAGTYTVPFLRPGNYKLTVTAQGFNDAAIDTKFVTLVPLSNATTAAVFSTTVGAALFGWRCGLPADGNTVPSRFLPGSCRG